MNTTSLVSTHYERRIDSRAGTGATAWVRQRSRLRIARLSAAQPAIIVIVRGEKSLQGAGGMVISAGQAICLDRGTYNITNRPAADGLFESFWLAWEPGQIAAFSARNPIRQGNCPQRINMIEPDFHNSLMAARSALITADVPESITRHRMEEVLWWLHEKGIAFDNPVQSNLTDRVGQVLAGDPGHDWTLATVADRLAMSEATLRRRLAVEGTGFSDLLIDSRMSLALTLLQCTDYAVSRIAIEVGYDSPSRFAVRFRKRFGFSPSAVRGHSR